MSLTFVFINEFLYFSFDVREISGMGTLIILIISISSANQDEVYHPLNMDFVDLHGTLLSLLYKVLSLYYTPLDNSSELQKHEYRTTSFQSKESQHGLFVGKDAGKPPASTKRRTRSIMQN